MKNNEIVHALNADTAQFVHSFTIINTNSVFAVHRFRSFPMNFSNFCGKSRIKKSTDSGWRKHGAHYYFAEMNEDYGKVIKMKENTIHPDAVHLQIECAI